MGLKHCVQKLSFTLMGPIVGRINMETLASSLDIP